MSITKFKVLCTDFHCNSFIKLLDYPWIRELFDRGTLNFAALSADVCRDFSVDELEFLHRSTSGIH